MLNRLFDEFCQLSAEDMAKCFMIATPIAITIFGTLVYFL